LEKLIALCSTIDRIGDLAIQCRNMVYHGRKPKIPGSISSHQLEKNTEYHLKRQSKK